MAANSKLRSSTNQGARFGGRLNSIYSALLRSFNVNMASGSRSAGYHSAVRGPGPPSLHPSNKPGPQTLTSAMLRKISKGARLGGCLLLGHCGETLRP